MNTIRDIEKYVCKYFLNYFDIPCFFDVKRNIEIETILRRITSIECYLQDNLTRHKPIIFSPGYPEMEKLNFYINYTTTNSFRSMSYSIKKNEIHSTDYSNFYIKADDFFRIKKQRLCKIQCPISLFIVYFMNFAMERELLVNDIQDYFINPRIEQKGKTDKYQKKIRELLEEAVNACENKIGIEKLRSHLDKQKVNVKNNFLDAAIIEGQKIIMPLYQDVAKNYKTYVLPPGLYNIKPIENKQPNPDIIILTESYELAFFRQRDILTRNIKNIEFAAWDYPHAKIGELDWSPLKGRHVFYLLVEHSGREPEEIYKTSLEVKKELDKVNIKNFRYIDCFREKNQDNKLPTVINPPNIFSAEEYHFLKNHPAQPAMSLKQYKLQEIKTQKTLLHPYLKTGTATLIYGNPEVNKTVFTLALAHAMRLGQCAFKGWREGKENSSGIYCFNNHGDSQANIYFKNLKKIAEEIFVKRNKYKNMPSGYIYPPDFEIILKNYDSLSNKADFIKENIQTLSPRKFIILENIYSNSKLLPEQNSLVRELTDCGWCVVIAASLNSMDKKLFFNKMTAVDNVIKLNPQRPSIFGNTKMKVEVKSSNIVPFKERKNVICEFSLDPEHPTCKQISLEKRKKFTQEERDKIKADIEEIVKYVNNVADDKLPETKKITSDRAIAEKWEITVSMVKKLRKEVGWQKNKNRFVKIDHERYIKPQDLLSSNWRGY